MHRPDIAGMRGSMVIRLRPCTTRIHPPLTPPPLPTFFFLAVAATGGRVRSFARGVEPLLRTRGMNGSRSVYGKAPMRRLHSNPIAVSGSGHNGKHIKLFDAAIHTQESPPHKRFLVGCSLPSMRLAENLANRFALGASDVCLVGENPTCSVPAL